MLEKPGNLVYFWAYGTVWASSYGRCQFSLVGSALLDDSRIHENYQIEGFRPWDLSHEKERKKLCGLVQFRASGTVWASSYAQIIVFVIFHGKSNSWCNCSYFFLWCHDFLTVTAQRWRCKIQFHRFRSKPFWVSAKFARHCHCRRKLRHNLMLWFL